MLKKINFFRNILNSNLRRPGFPYKLTFAITYRCNLRCQTCRIWEKEKREELSVSDIELFFKRNSRFNWVDFTGGEIFLRKDLVDIIRVAIENSRYLYLLHFPTNGYLTRKIVSEVKEILNFKTTLFVVTVSLDGPPALHDTLRGINGAWLNAIETFKGLKTLKDKRFKVYLGMTLSKYNSGLVKETYQKTKERIPAISYNDFHFNIAQTSNHFYKNADVDLGVDKGLIKDIKEIIKEEKIFSAIKFLEYIYQKLSSKYIETKRPPVVCKALSASVFLDPYGDVYPCSIWSEKIDNLRDFDFDLKKIWDSKDIKKIRHRITNRECPGCWTPCEAYQAILGSLLGL
ncbi:MAG: radical SAM protein [Candidatus Omnitrophica bacterium]|nr:radical SAM protein [Candidatus Omnitrophota bacterium]